LSYRSDDERRADEREEESKERWEYALLIAAAIIRSSKVFPSSREAAVREARALLEEIRRENL
jgi:hypothetical protein